jgi:hypothetical protein
MEQEKGMKNAPRKAGWMSLRFWRPSPNGQIAAKHLIAGVGVLALLVGLLTTSGQGSQAPSAVQGPQPPLPQGPRSQALLLG